MTLLIVAVGQAHLGVFAAALAFGLVVGLLGHLARSRTLILAGIIVIAVVSAYFSFVLQPTSR